jgi:outer membrane protein OmpA-like peptidoglycan-associated protein/opacity protein-like surface antigen
MKRWLMTMMVLALTTGLVHAETWEDQWGLGLEVGAWKQIHGDRDYSNVDQFTSLKVRRGLSERWALDMGFKYGWTRPGVEARGEDAGLSFDSGAGLYTRIWQPSFTGTYFLVTEGTWMPWVSVGAGVTRWDVRDLRGEDSVGLWPDGTGRSVFDEDGARVDGHGVNLTAILGVGTAIAVSERWSFDLGVRYNYLLGQDKDMVGMSSFWGADHVDANKAIVEGLVGVTFKFGSTDKDGDGIPNKHDQCPEEPEDFDGFQDADGCPDHDNDGDGIPDATDQCPNEAEDVDGYQDQDGCPDPDNDGDGIADHVDECPDEAEDFDGFQDQDGCPDLDNDGDGVLDAQDKCPNTPTGIPVDADGCPVVKEILEDLVLEGVNFKISSDELTPESAQVLDDVAESLQAWPDVRVEVGGHTDSTGSAEFNRELSRQRAESVRQFLIDRGVDGDRITAIGYGEDQPVADNSTPIGRAANRRVELKRVW